MACARRGYAYASRVLRRRVQLSLLVLQLVSAATLLRSIAYDRWITVLASVLLIVGALAAQRGRTWGVGLALATAAAFPVAFAIGIAPAWFCLVGIAGALPFALTLRPFARFDKGATALFAVLAGVGGAAVAMGWKEIAYSVFTNVPFLRPSGDAQHGLTLAATLAVVVGLIAGRARGQTTADGARVRIGERVRVGESNHSDAEVMGLLDEEEAAPASASSTTGSRARRA